LARELRKVVRERDDNAEHAASLQSRLQAENEEMYRAGLAQRWV
jgi:hypothetical protein